MRAAGYVKAIGRKTRLTAKCFLGVAVFTTALILSLAGPYEPQSAFASSFLQVGEFDALAGVPNSADYDSDLMSLKAKSSDSSVVSCSARKPDGYTGKRELFAHAQGFGSATVTVSWTVRERSYNEKTGKSSYVKRAFTRIFEYRVAGATIKKAYCDHLFAGRDYTISSLFKGLRSQRRISYLPKQGKGRFAEGQGYTVSANGKKVRFAKQASDLTVNYNVGGSTYPIRVAAVHSQESLTSKLVSSVKKLCYYPSSLKVNSVSFRNSKLYVSFSAVNLAGVRNNSRVCAYFDRGVFKFEKLS